MRVVLCLIFAFAAVGAQALPQFWKLFNEHYKPDGEIAAQQCVTCHTAKGETTRNPFGRAVQAQLEASAGQDLTVAMLQQVEQLDSDGDGKSNIDEIKAGTMPGHAEGSPAQSSSDLIPKHSFHPTFVHFPIALFLFGAAFDFFGWRKRRSDCRFGAFAAMVVGAFSSLVAIPTGILAWQRLGFPLEGTLLIHLILAVSAAVLMLSVSAWRRKSELTSTAYWLFLAIAAVTVSVAGHFGAKMIYG